MTREEVRKAQAECPQIKPLVELKGKKVPKWLLKYDIKPGEQFYIWGHDTMFSKRLRCMFAMYVTEVKFVGYEDSCLCNQTSKVPVETRYKAITP